MPFYKTRENVVHFIDSNEFAMLLPIGSIEIADEEAQLLLPQLEPTRITLVSMRQARRALLGAGLLSQVQGAIDSLPSPQKEAAQIDWEYAGDVERDSPLVQMLAPALGLTEAQMDELFTVAAKL